MTHEEVSKLTDEEIRFKVAELCGTWRWRHCYDLYGKDPFFDSPNYPEDLNACHEFEKTIHTVQVQTYRKHLQSLVEQEVETGMFGIWHATARQRCEALLMTMTAGETS